MLHSSCSRVLNVKSKVVVYPLEPGSMEAQLRVVSHLTGALLGFEPKNIA